MMEAVQGRAAGQEPLVIGRDIHQRLEQRILADDLGVVAIGIAGEDLINLLREERFAAVGHQLLGAGIGKAWGNRG
jgi:predicted RecB family endonuclease